MAATNPAQGSTKLTLHWLEKSRAQRTLFLLEELNLQYELKTYKRTKEMGADPALKTVHGLGKSPVVSLTAPDGRELVLAESGAMTEYLADYFGPHLIPARFEPVPDAFQKDPVGAGEVLGDGKKIGGERTEWLRYRFYMHYAEGSLMTALLLGLLTSSIRAAKVPFPISFIVKKVADRADEQFVAKNIKTHLDFLEKEMQGYDYFAGPNFTGADVLMIFPLSSALNRKIISEASHPNLAAWVKRVEGREAYKRGIEKIRSVTGEYTANV